MAEDGRLETVEVEGWPEPAYMHPQARCPRSVDALTVLSPFDPIVWNRDRASRLWNFDYRIEIYVPASKRVYGYYVLPVLAGDQLAARLDLKTDRKSSELRVLGAYSFAGQVQSGQVPRTSSRWVLGWNPLVPSSLSSDALRLRSSAAGMKKSSTVPHTVQMVWWWRPMMSSESS